MHTTNRPPTPAAVRAAMTPLYLRTHADDDALADDPRDDSEVLRDHIRAITEEMRGCVIAIHDEGWHPGDSIEEMLIRFADKLEGKL